VETDPARLLPPGDPAIANAAEVQRRAGLSGELDLVLTGPDVTQPDEVGWLTRQTVNLVSGSGGDLRPVQSLPEFLAGFNDNSLPDRKQTALILQRIPSYFSGAVVSPDHHTALSILGITRLTSVERDSGLVDRVASVAPPPAADRTYPAGLAVVAASALEQLQRDQVPLTALTLLVVAVILAAAYRRPVPVLLVLLPTVAAGGAGIALLLVNGSQSNPMTVLLGGVVIAFATEFSVLWLGRYRSELASGQPPAAAARIAGARISPAILASALALIAGFATLGLSPVPAVQEFGAWSAIDLALATAAVLILLPTLARSWLTAPRRAPRSAAAQPQPVGEPLPHS
jgi:predicted RND superfamily exporter protein